MSRLLVLAMLLAGAADTLQAQAGLPREAEIYDLVRRYVEAREKRDAKAIEALFTADADQLVSSGEWRRGREAVVKGTLASSSATAVTKSAGLPAARHAVCGRRLSRSGRRVCGASAPFETCCRRRSREGDRALFHSLGLQGDRAPSFL